VYGRSKAEAEQRVLDKHPGALVVRTSAFFGPWDKHNFVTWPCRRWSAASPSRAASDMTVSPTYVPDLVHACLDLAIDGEAGIWHLANAGGVSWAELALKAADAAGVDASRLEAVAGRSCGIAPRARATRHEQRARHPAAGAGQCLARYLELRKQGMIRRWKS
jgi:dTDP-4-dehydrorhamnose reductase